MAMIRYPTSSEVPGPWLFDPTNLKELDALLDESVESMRQKREELIDAELQREREQLTENGRSEEEMYPKGNELRSIISQRYSFAGESRKITVYLSGGRTVRGTTFRELMALGHVHNEVPRGFVLNANVGSMAVEVGLRLWQSSDLEIRVSGNQQFAEELFGKFQNWASELQPRRWQQWWLKMQTPLRFGLAPMLIVCLLGFLVVSFRSEAGPSPVRQEAIALAKQGVNQANESKAIQLLLSLEVGYEPAPIVTIGHRPTLRFLLRLMLLVAFWIGLMLPPNGAIGLWLGKNSVLWQRRWIQFASVSLPGVLIGSIVVPVLLRLIGLQN